DFHVTGVQTCALPISWALVRTRGYGDGRNEGRSWLLIKHRDDWSGDLDITEFAPLSVKSECDFHEILAAENPEVWRSNRPVNTEIGRASCRDRGEVSG